MKSHIKGGVIISALFIAIALIASTTYGVFLSPEASISIIIISIISFGISVSLIISKRQDKIEKNFADVSSSICDVIKRIEEVGLQNKNDIIECASKIQKDINENLSAIAAQEEERGNKIKESINLAAENFAAELNKAIDCIGQNKNDIIDRVTNVQEGINSNLSSIAAQEEERGKNMKESIDLASGNFVAELNKAIDCIGQNKNDIIDRVTNVQEGINSNLSSIAAQEEERGYKIKESIDLATGSFVAELTKAIGFIDLNKNDIINRVSKVQEGFNNNLSAISAQEEERGNKIKESIDLATGNFMAELKKINDGIDQNKKDNDGSQNIIIEKVNQLYQQGESLNEAIKSSSELICSKASELNEGIAGAANDLKMLSEVNNGQHNKVVERLENMANDGSKVKATINDYIQSFETKTSELQTAVKNVSQDVSTILEAKLSDGLTTISTTIAGTTPLISAELGNVLKKCIEIKDELLRVGNGNQTDILSGISSSTESIIEKLGAIENNYSGLLNLFNEDNEAYDKAAEEFIEVIHNKYSSLHEGIQSLISTANLIEKEISEFNISQNVADIISSINSSISELSGKLNSAVVDINRNTVESQLAQGEITKDEIAKLQILLRTLLNKDTVNQNSTPEDPNRTETICDGISGNTVLNHYKNNMLVKSDMKNKQGIVIYELSYRDGKISQSKSYDDSGTLKIEQTYYDNGQVHFRDEFRKDGKYSSEFERNGNKK